MKIIVIDDEPVIGNGIAKTVESINSEWKVTGIYNDAQEAMELCNWDDVQVALTDISMPNMDGLKMLSILRQQGYEVLVVFITAYANFEYAKAAVHLQAMDYLLKPVSRKDLEAILSKAEQQWEQRLAKESDTAYIAKNLRQLRKYFLSDLIFEERFLTQQQIEENEQQYQLINKQYMLIVFFSSDEKNKVKNHLQECLLLPEGADWFLYGKSQFYVLLIVANQSLPDDFISILYSSCKSMCFSANISYARELAEHYCKLILQLSQSLETTGENIEGKTITDPLAGKEFSVPVNQTLHYIQKNYNKKLTLKSLSEHVYLHPTYLSNIFKKQTGFTVVDYINYYRIMQAQKMLQNPYNKIYWVMEQVGFVNQRYFSEVFKKITSLTPTQYKQNSFLANNKDL